MVEKKKGVIGLETVKPEEVTRVFFLQPIGSQQILESTDLKKISLIEVVMIRKDARSNHPNSIIPVGGVVDTGNETIEAAARREALEESHLFPELLPLQSTQTYSFMNRGTKTFRKVHFFIGRLFSPKFDKPWALNKDVDKIEDFVSVDIDTLVKLFSGEKIGKDELVESLTSDEAKRKEKTTEANSDEIKSVQRELLSRLKIEEAKRKMAVLKVLISKGFRKLESPDLEDQLEKLEIDFNNMEVGDTEYVLNVQDIWEENIEKLSSNKDDFKSALEFVSIQDVLLDLEKHQIDTEGRLPTLHMMFPILFGFNFDRRLTGLIKSNEWLGKIYIMSRALFLFNNINTKNKRAKSSERLLRKITNIGEGDLSEDSMIVFFKRQGFLSDDFEMSFGQIGTEIDLFFQNLQQQTKISPRKASLSHINEVQGQNFTRIVGLAFSPTGSKKENQIKFEAQRKLLLAALVFEAKKYSDNLIDRGVQELDDLEKKLEVESEDRESGRSIRLAGKVYPVIIERRIKDFHSLVRKILVRDVWNFGEAIYMDVFAESYIFDESSINEMTEDEREVPMPMTNGKNKNIDTYTAPLVVHNFLVELKQNLSEDESLEVLQFKGLPKAGARFDSHSLGGGAKVRLLKLYLQHTDNKGIKRIREVQVYLPKKVGDVVVSGEEDYNDKKKDDTNYALNRLFLHGNIYSLIELLFPHFIYGDTMKTFFEVKKDE